MSNYYKDKIHFTLKFAALASKKFLIALVSGSEKGPVPAKISRQGCLLVPSPPHL